MDYLISLIVGAAVATLLISRLTMWLFKWLGDNERRLLVAHGASFGLATVLAGFGLANGGAPQFLNAAATYLLPSVAWLVMDWLALRGRRARSGG